MPRDNRRPMDRRRRHIGVNIDPATWRRFRALARAQGTSGAALLELQMRREIELAECDPLLRRRMDEIEPHLLATERKGYRTRMARTRPDRRWAP
jgi:hypothetical protein